MKKIKSVLYIFIAIIAILGISGCSKETSEKQLIGFTIFEKSTPIGMSQKTLNLETQEINGFFANSEYTETTFSGNSYFDVKVDYNKLQGDLVSSDSVCLFVTANYYQAQSVNYKLFLYDIYLLEDGTYQLEYHKDIELPQNVGSNEIVTMNYESKNNSTNYVFTYKLTIQKTANPIETVVREFGANNVMLKETKINDSYTEIVASDSTDYIIVTERFKFVDENNEEQIDKNYIFISKKTEKKTYSFSMLNTDSKMINYVVTFNFPTNDEIASK